MLSCPKCGSELRFAEVIDSGKYPLTKRQREILDYLSVYLREFGYAPSFEEIAAHMKYNSLSTVHEHLSNLERKGYIRRHYNEWRSIELLFA